MIQLKHLEMCKQITWGMKVEIFTENPPHPWHKAKRLWPAQMWWLRRHLGYILLSKSFKGLQIEETGSAPQINEHVHSMVYKRMGLVEKKQTHHVTGALCQRSWPLSGTVQSMLIGTDPTELTISFWGGTLEKKWKEHLLSDRGPTVFIIPDCTQIHSSLSPLLKKASLNFFYVFHF